MDKKLIICILMFCCLRLQPPVSADNGHEPGWLLPQWQYRLIVGVIPQDRRAEINTAEIALAELGKRCRPDGADVRVFDKDGNQVSHRAVHSDTGTLSVLFEVGKASRYSIYFGNPKAGKLEAKWNEKLGGLYLETRKIKKPIYQWSQIAGEVAAGRESYGKKKWRQIYDLHNPFGPDEMYLSIYEGTILCPRDGTYAFATNSDDCSVVYVGQRNKPVCARRVGVPSEDWVHPEHPRAVGRQALKLGVHRVWYYHIENSGGQLAQLGWARPGERVIVTVPPRVFVTYLPATILALEQRGRKITPFFDYEHVYNLKINNSERVFPMFRLWSCSGEKLRAMPGISYSWKFPDGSPQRGAGVSHEFVFEPARPQEPEVALQVKALGLTDTVRRSLKVPKYPVEYMDLMMEIETGEPVVKIDQPVKVKIFVKNQSRHLRAFEFTTSLLTGETRNELVSKIAPHPSLKLVEKVRTRAGRGRNVRSSAATPVSEGEEEKWMSFERTVPISDSNVLFDMFLRFHGHVMLERRVGVFRTDLPLGELRVDASQRLRDADNRYVVLRLADRAMKDNIPARIPVGSDKEVKIVVFDHGLADVGSEDAKEPSYLTYLPALLKKTGSEAQKYRFKLDGIFLHQPGGYPPLERLCMTVKMLQDRKANFVIITTSPEDIVNSIPLRDFSISLTATIDQVLTQTKAMPVVVTPPPLPGSEAVSRKYARQVKLIGIRKGIPVIDIYSGFMLQDNWPSLFYTQVGSNYSYGLRPNAEGQQLVARMIQNKLLNLIGKK